MKILNKLKLVYNKKTPHFSKRRFFKLKLSILSEIWTFCVIFAIMILKSTKNSTFWKHMQYNELRRQLKDFLVFSLNDIRKIEPNFHRPNLNEWQGKGYIKKLRRGYYIFADAKLNEEALFLIANKLYSPSYISFEMAFSYYNLIPESVYGITSATTSKTNSFKTAVGEFFYHCVKPGLMFGYKLVNYQNQNFKIAEIEKALLDYFYINQRFASEADFFELRFNGKEFLARADMAKFNNYLTAFNNNRLSKRMNKFLYFINKSK